MSSHTRPVIITNLLIKMRRFAAERRAATSIEYAIIAAGVSVAIVGVVAGLGSNVQGFYNSVSTALK